MKYGKPRLMDKNRKLVMFCQEVGSGAKGTTDDAKYCSATGGSVDEEQSICDSNGSGDTTRFWDCDVGGNYTVGLCNPGAYADSRCNAGNGVN
jgi:hypothetical protein